MGRRSHRRSASQDEDNVGCVWGLMRMLYFRRDPKFLLDTKQLNARHTFREINDRGHQTKRSWDFDEREDGSMDACTSEKPSVKNLMEDELETLKLLEKTSNDEVQKRLPCLGNDASFAGRLKNTNKPTQSSDRHTDMSVPVDSEVLNHAEEYDLESVLANFLGEIYSCHNECPHGDCKNNNELCPSLKSLIHKKVSDLNNLPCNIDHGQPQESHDGMQLDTHSLSSTVTAQTKQFKDALEILTSNKELFLKLLQKPNPQILDNIQRHQESKVLTGLEPNKICGQTNLFGGRTGSSQHPLATKEQAKESKHIFFWKKDKSNRSQKPEMTDGSQTISKIVILKPNLERTDQKMTAGARSFSLQPCTSHAPECSERESSRFSIKGIKRRFRIVSGESRRERNVAPAEDLQRDPRRVKDSVVAIKKDFRCLPEGSLADKSAASFKNEIRPLISSKQKQQNGSTNEIRTVARKDASIFYEEAKRHLTEILKDNEQSVNCSAVPGRKSLEGILHLPDSNLSSPRNSLRIKDCPELVPVEMDVCKDEKEECAQEIRQSQDDLGRIACCASEAVDDQVTIQEGYCMDEARGLRNITDEPDTMYIEGIDKLDSEKICNTECISSVHSPDGVKQEMLEESNQGKECVKVPLDFPESIIENVELHEPETPEPRASTEVILHGSPEQSNEKPDKPSPVSVLEPLFEDVGSPDYINKKECGLHEGLHRTLYFPDCESDMKGLWEDKNVRFDYIKLVLELSELCAEQNLEVWYLEDELISPCLFEELQNEGDEIDDLKLLFDCTCEALTDIQDRYFRLSSWLSFLKHDIGTPPIGENLVTEVDRYVYKYVQYSPPSTLEQIMKRDLEIQTWMNIRPKTEEIVMEVWEFIMDELIDEAVFDLWI